MSSPLRLGLVAALATACHFASAQTVVSPTITVTRIAPQLVSFAGSSSNFQNLVNGLTSGTQVQLVTVLPDGSSQIVTFTPTSAMSPTQAAQVLETARQRLIGLGIANPTAEQIATTLMGGVVPTALGGSQVTGVLSPQNVPSPAVQAQANAAIGSTAALGGGLGASTGATTPTTPSTVTPPVNVQVVPGTPANTTTTDALRVNTSDSLVAPGSVSRSPIPATPAPPGPASTPNPPAPGAGPSAIAPAPSATAPTTLPAAPATPAQPGNSNSGLSAIRR